MAFKYIVLFTLISIVAAGGPAAYSISAPSADYGSIGHSQENTVKGLYGQNVQSHYSKSVDSAHSSVRVASSRYTNDNLGHYGAAPAYAHSYAPAIAHAPLLAAPAIKYAAPALSYAHAAPRIATYGHAATYGHGAYGHPAYGHGAFGHAAYGHGAFGAPIAAIGHAPLASYSHAIRPVGHVAPLAYGHTLGHGIAAPISTLGHGYGLGGYAVKAPVASVVHTSFAGLGANYAW